MAEEDDAAAGPGFHFPQTYARSRIEDDTGGAGGRARRSRLFVETLRKQMDDIKNTPMYTPEQQQARNYANDKDYKLGMLMALSGGDNLQAAGGQLFKHALAQRTPTITEHGMANPLTGEYSYSPDYQRRTLQARIDAADLQASRDEDTSYDRNVAREDRQENQRWMLAHRPPDPSVVVVQNPDGTFTYAPRSGAVGKTAPPPASAAVKPPTEDQSKAGGWYAQATSAYGAIKKAVQMDPHAAEQPLGEVLTSAVPGVGEQAAYARMTPARQLFNTGVSELTEAVLRAASGANVPPHEAKQKIRALTPQYGEAPEVSAWKETQMQQYLDSLYLRAGRAAQGLPAPPGGVRSGPAAAPAASGAKPGPVDFNSLPP